MTVEELKVIVSAETNGFNASMDGVKNKLGEVGSGKGFASALKSGFASVGKIALAGAGVAGVAIGKITKDALNSFSQYQQLEGGVTKLFGKDSATVIKNASNAYKTAGMSANEYMETVTGMSASLIQSLGGDTAKASSQANKAIQDMSDNANVFGSDIGSIQNAYAGFAKGNFTMLDNLKLGYGGTKTEMQRLLADAQKLTGQKYDLSSYSDIVDAIHAVQVEQGIAGTTAKESASTIEGSVNTMKGAWTNFLTGLGNSNADMKGLSTNLITSVGQVVKNVMPVVKQVFSGIATAIPPLVSQALGKLREVIESKLGSICRFRMR